MTHNINKYKLQSRIILRIIASYLLIFSVIYIPVHNSYNYNGDNYVVDHEIISESETSFDSQNSFEDESEDKVFYNTSISAINKFIFQNDTSCNRFDRCFFEKLSPPPKYLDKNIYS